MSEEGADPGSSVTALLRRWSKGERAALDELMPLLYPELHRLAGREMVSYGSDHTLQTTALIHEAYVRLAGSGKKDWTDRNHFLSAAAKVMRHVLVDYARNRRAVKRGGMLQIVPIQDGIDAPEDQAREIVALHEGLAVLEAGFPRPAEVVELRYFGGLSIEEVAGVLKLSAETVGRDIRFARSFLKRELSRGQ